MNYTNGRPSNAQPHQRFWPTAGFVVGMTVGYCFGSELADAARYFFRSGAIDFVMNAHPIWTRVGVAATVAVIGREAGIGIEELFAPLKYGVKRAAREIVTQQRVSRERNVER